MTRPEGAENIPADIPGRPGEREAVEAGVAAMYNGPVPAGARQRFPEVEAIVAAVYPAIARAVADEIAAKIEETLIWPVELLSDLSTNTTTRIDVDIARDYGRQS